MDVALANAAARSANARELCRPPRDASFSRRKSPMKKITVTLAILAALAASATAYAAISADEAKAIAAKEVPASSTHLFTKAEMHKLTPYFEVKFYDNATNTEYEIDVLQASGAIKEFSLDNKTVFGSSTIGLSTGDVQNIILKEHPQANIYKLELDRDNGLYEYEVKFTAPGVRGEYTLNAETGAVMEKELKYQF